MQALHIRRTVRFRTGRMGRVPRTASPEIYAARRSSDSKCRGSNRVDSSVLAAKVHRISSSDLRCCSAFCPAIRSGVPLAVADCYFTVMRSAICLYSSGVTRRPIDQVMRRVVRPVGNDACRRLIADAGQRCELRLRGVVEIDGVLRRWTAQTVSYSFSHSLGIVLDLGGSIGGRLPHLFRVRWLRATRAAARQQQQKRHCDGRWKDRGHSHTRVGCKSSHSR